MGKTILRTVSDAELSKYERHSLSRLDLPADLLVDAVVSEICHLTDSPIVISASERARSCNDLPGRIVAIEGIDQSGKRTQAQMLAGRLGRIGVKTGMISFPIYGSPAGRQISQYLTGKRMYAPEALHMLYSLNRWENKDRIVKLMDISDIVIADRYTPSNLAYGVSRGLSLQWLQGLDRGLPPASLIIVLDVPTLSSFARKSEKRDVHESDRRFLTRVEQTYKVLARKLGWQMVDATGPAEQVHATVWRIVRKRLNLTWPGNHGLG